MFVIDTAPLHALQAQFRNSMREPSKKSQKTSPHPLMGYLGFQLRQATVLMQSDLSKRLAAHGLNMIEMSTLLIIEASAGVTPAQIGAGTKIWHFSHVLPGAVIGENCSLGQNVVMSAKARMGRGCTSGHSMRRPYRFGHSQPA